LRSAAEDPWNSICGWGPTALLPVFNILGTKYKDKSIVSHLDEDGTDQFTKISFIYDHAVASIKVGKGVKSEGELVISGTKGYIYVPAPWWKTDYFEIRYEDQTQNKRYFYQLEGEGIRYELVAFVKAIECGKNHFYIGEEVSNAICKVVEDFYDQKDFIEI
jgi:choline-phosphate cytidylyltransferase